jgi:hypothetical protein
MTDERITIVYDVEVNPEHLLLDVRARYIMNELVSLFENLAKGTLARAQIEQFVPVQLNGLKSLLLLATETTGRRDDDVEVTKRVNDDGITFVWSATAENWGEYALMLRELLQSPGSSQFFASGERDAAEIEILY